MIHSSYYRPIIIPVLGGNGDETKDEIHRVQSIDKTGTLNRQRVEEVGRDGVVDYVKQNPSVTYRMTQNEYGALDFFEQICNKNGTSLTLADFKTPAFDILSYMTDDDSTFKGTLWLPKLRTSGFSISIGDPNSIIERSFDFVGEDWIQWQGNNQYLIYREETVESGEFESGTTVHYNLTSGAYPTPVVDPDDNSTYVQRLVRVRGTTSTELTSGTDYYYEDDDKVLTIWNAAISDTYKIWYTAASYISGGTIFTNNDTDSAGIHANAASIYMKTGTYCYKLQSLTLDVRFEREDLFEIGNKEVVQRGVRNKTVTYTLGRILDAWTIEEAMRGKTADYGKLDIREFGDDIRMEVKFFEDHNKSTFKLGFKSTDLTPSEIRGGASIDNYVDQGDTLTGEDLTISNVEATIDS